MSFLALRDLAVCMKTKTCFFFMKTGYFNTECCIFSNIKILLDINQNDIKNTRKIVRFQKIFLNFFKKNWAGPGPTIMGWA